MTEYVNGKKYRVTREFGAMTYDADTNMFRGNGDVAWAGDTRIFGELIPDPLPTTPGSVIAVDWRRSRPLFTMLGVEGKWWDEEGDEWEASFLAERPWTLIYDAGAQQA